MSSGNVIDYHDVWGLAQQFILLHADGAVIRARQIFKQAFERAARSADTLLQSISLINRLRDVQGGYVINEFVVLAKAHCCKKTPAGDYCWSDIAAPGDSSPGATLATEGGRRQIANDVQSALEDAASELRRECPEL